ncbi:MAG TPA: energy transducer TonB [Tenuifilaceae bacterium]|nr:energy transducer TonB [Tenuifilaceae bacterium]
MELKKNPKVDLEKKKLLFTEIGLLLALAFVLLAFEWTSTGGVKTDLAGTQDVAMEEEMIPITQQEEIKPPPPPPQQVQVPEIINIVEDDVDLDDDMDLFDTEFNEDVAVNIIEFNDEEEEEVEEEEIFVIVEDMPGFGGGDSNKFREYIAKNLKYPDIAAENGIQGRVFVAFVVEPDGRVSNVRVVRGVDPALDKEAVRVVQSSPKWKPGMQRGKPVRVSFTFPIIFVLQ